MSSSTRPTRSRISSPFAPASAPASAHSPAQSIETAESAADKPKTMLDKWMMEGAASKSSWTEPAPAPPRPSYQEAGHIKHSVVTNMQPLGVGPSAKVLKALSKGEAERSKKAASSFSTPEVEETPEPATAEPELPRRKSLPANKPEAPEEVVEAPPKTPQQPTSARKSVSRPSAGPQSAGQSVFAVRQSPMPSAMPTPQPDRPQRYTSSESPEPALGPDGLAIINLDFTDRVVEAAVQEALDRFKWPTAYALRLLWDEHRTDPAMVRIFDGVYNGWGTNTEKEKFRTMVRRKKKEAKKGRTGEYYFNGDESNSGPSRPIFNAINIINPPAPTYQTPYATPLAQNRPSNEPQASSSSIPPAPASAAASPQADHEHINKKQRSNSFQPADAEVNGHAERNGTTTKSQSPGLANGASKTTPRSQRSRSNSSSSSLSSVNEELIEDSSIISPPRPAPPLTGAIAAPASASARSPASIASHFGAKFGLGLGLGFGAAQPQPRFVSPYASANNFQEAALSAETQARNAARPISAPPKPGPRTFTFSTVTSSSPAIPRPSSANTSLSTTAVAANDPPSTASTAPMAPAILLHSSSNSSTTSSKKFPATFKIKNANKAQGIPHDENDANSRLKRKAKEITARAAITESFERHRVVRTPVVEEIEWASDGGDSIAVRAKKKQKKSVPKVRLLHRSRETRQNSRYASDEGSSPTELAFKPPFPPGDSLPSSRAGTPIASNRPAKRAKTGSGLRVKTSPMKKKTGTSAGIPKDMRSPTSNGGALAQDGENDDYCSACGGNGDLVCCDGCTRSFHFKCVDPPIVEDAQHLSDEWYCNSCQSKELGGRAEDDTTGIWGRLLSDFEDKNPRSFHLPQPIRDYFVDVKTGAEGEYEEILPPKPKHNNRAGWEEAPDYFRKKDAKGKIILCHRCNGEAVAPNRMIIPCSFCGLSWHLDCLPNPLAKEPGSGRQWRCPAHVDDLLAVLPESLAPAHRFRKIKGAPAIVPSASRGIKNNGHIEIENDPSEDEEEQGFYELREFGHVYKLPEQGIKLDFISRVKQMRGDYLPSLYSSRPKPEPAPRTTVPSVPSEPSIPSTDKPWTQRNVEEQQAALNLASLLASSKDPALGADTGLLINTLMAEAPPAVISMMAQSSAQEMAAPKLAKKEKQSMTAIFEFLKKKLEEAESSSDEEDPAPATPVALAQEPAVIPDKENVASIASPVATVTETVEDAKAAGEDTEMEL